MRSGTFPPGQGEALPAASQPFKEDQLLPIQVVETQRLYQQIADQLGELIRRGEFPAGRLPAERDLARQLGVSRPVVREAMVALEIAGLVEVRTGSGIYVRAPDRDAAVRRSVLPDAGPSPFDLIAARKLLEPEIVLAAAASLTDEDLKAVAEALERMREAAAAGRDIMVADRLFHVRIAAATRNTVLASMVDQLWEQTTAPIYSGLRRRTDRPEHHRVALAHHERVLEALRRRDGPAARQAMRAHLAQTEATLMEADITP